MSDFMSTREAARILDVTTRYVVMLLNDGRLKGTKLESQWVVNSQSVWDYKNKKDAQAGKSSDEDTQ